MTHSGIENPDSSYLKLRVALIALDESGRVLLLNHIRPQGSYWVLPGGGLEQGESLMEGVTREVSEELGVSCIINRLVAVGQLITQRITPARHVVDFFFEGSLSPGELKLTPDEGIAEARWVTADEIDRLVILPLEIQEVIRDLLKDRKIEFRYLGKYKIYN